MRQESYSYRSPVGYLNCRFNESFLIALDIQPDGRATPESKLPVSVRLFWKELDCYFEGGIQRFVQPIRFESGTPFQRRVWQALLRIPFGETRSYEWLATAADSPHGARAAGQAAGKNPLPIIVPCHRIIRADGGLGGFSCGVEVKRRLLKHEAAKAKA
ncbi:MAG TPA: methylated-DNA--[protein]-cysteine S-methyltransferase [Dissulfurispiraceae bacterium]|nr:methylated-DNA--[protein]-cysteine S-methyltransferase [Dissulfurispiraceae bacterium]